MDSYQPQSASPMNSSSSPTRDTPYRDAPAGEPTDQVADLPVPIFTDYATSRRWWSGVLAHAAGELSRGRDDDLLTDARRYRADPETLPLVLDPTLHRGSTLRRPDAGPSTEESTRSWSRS